MYNIILIRDENSHEFYGCLNSGTPFPLVEQLIHEVAAKEKCDVLVRTLTAAGSIEEEIFSGE